MTIDIGTGDGRAVLAAAARDPRTLVIGMDASAAAMAELSRRAAGPARKGGLPNAAFILAAAEAPPRDLRGVAERVTVQFPWGSLLRGCVGLDEAVAAGAAALVADRGALDLLIAPSVRDGLGGVPTDASGLAEVVAGSFARHGFELEFGRPATHAEVVASGSTWARRLGASRANGDAPDRSALLFHLVRR
ncbi:MAG: hypothetical protein ABIZ52_08440 [Candidatus Limnocylindrales bacterium]